MNEPTQPPSKELSNEQLLEAFEVAVIQHARTFRQTLSIKREEALDAKEAARAAVLSSMRASHEPQPSASKERAEFEQWLLERQGLTSAWNEDRRCYEDFPAHLAWRAWCDSSSTHEPPDDAPQPHWSEALQDDIYYASDIDPYIDRLRAAQPPIARRRPTLEQSDSFSIAEERDWWRDYALEIEGASQPPGAKGDDNTNTAADRPSAITAGEAAASDGDFACPVVSPSSREQIALRAIYDVTAEDGLHENKALFEVAREGLGYSTSTKGPSL